MRWKNSEDSYGLASIALHWSLALSFLGLAALGAWMVGLTYYDRWYNDSLIIHKAAGMAALLLALARLGWRVADPRPAFAPGLKPWERAGATVAHWTLGALIILVPASGYMISTSEGAGIDMFGLFEFPALSTISEQGREFAIDVHYWLAYGGVGLAAFHAGAALKHHFLDRSPTLMRMLLPGLRAATEEKQGKN